MTNTTLTLTEAIEDYLREVAEAQAEAEAPVETDAEREARIAQEVADAWLDHQEGYAAFDDSYSKWQERRNEVAWHAAWATRGL